MPNIAEIKEVMRHTPVEQATLLQGPHGIGKSEVLAQMFIPKIAQLTDPKTGALLFEADGTTPVMGDVNNSLGYDRLITLFLGQAADAGDIIGLPTRIPAVINGEETFVTEFAPPKWWPRNEDEKIVILLDELNRGKPEIMQCVMDMVLNRKLNGRNLPKHTKIIAAMNPLDDGYYQVEELDPAFLDRWNVYDFTPSNDEWLEWAFNNKINNLVRTFISSHPDHLDPPSSKDASAKSGVVFPSRRSWARISTILNNSPELKDAKKVKDLQTMIIGIVGNRSASAFVKFIREVAHNLQPVDILEKWDDKVQVTCSAMQIFDQMQLNTNIEYWIKDNFSKLKSSKERTTMVAKNLQNYLETISPEVAADFFDRFSRAFNDKQQWPSMIIAANKTMGDRFVKVMRGDV